MGESRPGAGPCWSCPRIRSIDNLQRDYPLNIRLTALESGLPMDTVFLCFQIRSLDPSRLIDPRAGVPVPAGTAPAARMADVEQAIRLVLGL